jgi:hypothetical protein
VGSSEVFSRQTTINTLSAIEVLLDLIPPVKPCSYALRPSTALQNTASIAGLLLTTESVVVERPEKNKAPSMGGGGMDGMY